MTHEVVPTTCIGSTVTWQLLEQLHCAVSEKIIRGGLLIFVSGCQWFSYLLSNCSDLNLVGCCVVTNIHFLTQVHMRQSLPISLNDTCRCYKQYQHCTIFVLCVQIVTWLLVIGLGVAPSRSWRLLLCRPTSAGDLTLLTFMCVVYIYVAVPIPC